MMSEPTSRRYIPSNLYLQYESYNCWSQVQQLIGYCPQFDALIERMTGRELLTMFARLRGIPESRIRDVVTSTINKLDLAKYGNRQCGKYR